MDLRATIDELRRLEQRATPGDWELWDGCSWRRFGVKGTATTVIEPIRHERDGMNDLFARRGYDDLRLVPAMRNALVKLLDAAERSLVLERLDAWHQKGRDVSIYKDDGMGASGGWEVELSQGDRKVLVAEYTEERWGGVTLAQLIGEALDMWGSDF